MQCCGVPGVPGVGLLLCLVCLVGVPGVPAAALSVSASVSGSCPPAVSLRVCEASCDSDQDCPGGLVCCTTGCGGLACVRRVSTSASAALDHPAPVKPGSCPPSEQGPWVCSHRCRADSDCAGATKCCKNRCGALACMAPEQ